LASCTVIFRMFLARPAGGAGHPTPKDTALVCRDSIHLTLGYDSSWLAGKTREAGLKRALLVGIALFIASAAPAEEMKSPHLSRARGAGAPPAEGLAERLRGGPAETFAKLNMAPEVAFPGTTNSSVPVLLPFDIDGFAKEITANPGQPADAIAASAA